MLKVSGKDRYEVQRVGDGESPFKTQSAADSMKPLLKDDSEDKEKEENEEKENST